MERGRGAVLALLGVLLVSVALPAPGAGAAIPTPSAPPTAARSISCPAAGTCYVALDVPPAGNVHQEEVLGTSDGGRSWRLLDQLGVGLYGAGFVSLSCPQAATCFLALGWRNTLESVAFQVLSTTDGGAVWASRLDTQNVDPTAFTCAGVQACMVGEPDGVVTTTDGGTSWATEAFPGTPADLACPSPTVCWAAAGSAGLEGTTDGGATWSPPGTITPGVTSVGHVACATVADCVASGQAPGGAVGLWTNDGSSWGAGVVNPATAFGPVACAPGLPVTCQGLAQNGTRPEVAWSGAGGTVWGFTRAPAGVDTLTTLSCPAVTACIELGTSGSLLPMLSQDARPLHIQGYLSGAGYWLVAADGGVFAFGRAGFFGSAGALPLVSPVVGMAPTSDRAGYWLVAADGGVFAYGDAAYLGSVPGLGIHPAGSGRARALAAPIVGLAATPDGRGYLLVGADGGVFAFGDAGFHGSCPSVGGCVGPVVAVVPDGDGQGYWLVTSAGRVYAFGDAPALGQPGPGPAPTVAAAASPDGRGYLVVDAAGHVSSFGDAPRPGPPPAGAGPSVPVAAVAPTGTGLGYWLLTAQGAVASWGDAAPFGSMAGRVLNAPVVAGAGF